MSAKVQPIKNWFRRLANRIFPQPQMHGFVGTIGVGSMLIPFVLKSLIVALPMAWLAYKSGVWVGDGRGYDRAMSKVAAETARLNAQIADLNDALEDARRASEERRDIASTEVMRSLADYTPERRKECAVKCSLPDAARASLGDID